MKLPRNSLRRKGSRAAARRPTLLYGVTIGLSARTLLADQLERFAADGYDVHLVSSPDERLAKADGLGDVRLWSVPMVREIAPVHDVVALARWVVTLRRVRPDVVNLATPKAALLGMMAARATGVPRRVYLVWGLRFEGETGRRRALLLAAERLVIACATDVVVVSESVGQEMIRAGLGRRPLQLIGEGSSNGVRAAELKAGTDALDSAEVRARVGVSDDTFVVGFIGRITGDKGLETLATAISSLRRSGLPVTLVVVGGVESQEVATTLRAAVPDMILIGWTDTPWAYFPAMDVLCLPTHREGFPNVVLEAAACGVPVVTTRATGARDAVQDGETGLLVDVGDAAGLATALRRLHDSRALGARLARAAQLRALTSFTPQRIWRGLDRIYAGQADADVRAVGPEAS